MKLTTRIQKLAEHRFATPILGFVSFIESSVFPVPPDALLIPMCLAKPQKWFFYALVTTITSVLGGLLGYAIGYYLFTEIGAPALDALGKLHLMEVFRGYYDEYGSLIVFGAGLTPFPYKVITIASGSLELSLAVFTIASILARGIRFFLVAFLVAYFGPPAVSWIKKNMALAFTLGFVAIVSAFVLYRLVM